MGLLRRCSRIISRTGTWSRRALQQHKPPGNIPEPQRGWVVLCLVLFYFALFAVGMLVSWVVGLVGFRYAVLLVASGDVCDI